MSSALHPAEAIPLQSLITIPQNGITSRVLSKTGGGSVTLFAFAAGEELSEHTSPFDALVWMLEGTMTLTIGGQAMQAAAGTLVRMPSNVPHGLVANEPARMLLIMLRDPKQG